MKKFFFGAVVAASSALATQAFAADLARKAPVYKAPPAPIFTWTGFYAGVNAGYGFGTDSNTITTGIGAANISAVADGARPFRVRPDRDGFVGGGQIGYNWQFAPTWVFGIEADIQYSDIRDTRNVQTVLAAVGPNGTAAGTRNNFYTTNMEYFGTVRGRLGYTFDRTMIYGTGGLAYGEVTNAATFTGVAPGFATQFVGARKRTDVGYTVGAGIEHAFTPNWSVKAEYLYYDLGDKTIQVLNVAGPGGAGGPGYNARFQNEGHIVRAGLNYKFGGGLFGY